MYYFSDNIDKRTLFHYVVLFIIIVFFFSFLKIGLNIIFGFVIACLIINFLKNVKEENKKKEKEIISYEKKYILPKPGIFDNHDDIIKYLFSVQDFYYYNPQAYEELTKNLEYFFRTYEESNNNKEKIGYNHNLMVLYKSNSVNALHSIIHTLPNNKEYTEKLNNAIIELNKILEGYLNKTEKNYEQYIFDNGYNNKTKLIYKHKIPYNNFTGIEKHYSYILF
jgi:hypothetical protein